jgi:hypothetical protein
MYPQYNNNMIKILNVLRKSDFRENEERLHFLPSWPFESINSVPVSFSSYASSIPALGLASGSGTRFQFMIWSLLVLNHLFLLLN